MRVDDLVLFTINTGEFYDRHMELGRRNDLGQWMVHVKAKAIPAYRRSCHEPYDGMSLDDIEKVAKELQLHYRQHLKEQEQNGNL